jgi:ribose transport system ATP-binding protein
MTTVLELRNVGKRYGGAIALSDVGFDVRSGEVHGLVGENGAGKSTMMKLLAGVFDDYDGELLLRGEPMRFASPADAQSKGIGMVHQELSTFQHLTVAENLFGRKLPAKGGLVVDWPRMRREAQEHLRELGLDIDAGRRMEELSVGSQQLVEIARVIFSGADLIILDEPTSALSVPETRRLFEFIASLKRQGRTLIFVSHFLEDVLEVSDRVTVLKNSRKVATLEANQATKHQLIELMIGSDARILQQTYEQSERAARRAARREPGGVVLALSGFSKRGAFDDVSFDVRAGEILGLFGFMGAGQNQLARCLFGAEPPDAGNLALGGAPLHLKNTSAARDAGIAYVPENRRDALMQQQEIYKNITLAHLGTLLRGLLNQRAELALAGQWSQHVGVRPAGRPLMPVAALSGGNQQKVVLAKWLTRQPKVLILNEPTRGMDVGAKDEVMGVVQSLASKGVATLLITTEPETIVAYADRALVMSKGRITTELAGAELTKDQLMRHA